MLTGGAEVPERCYVCSLVGSSDCLRKILRSDDDRREYKERSLSGDGGSKIKRHN